MNNKANKQFKQTPRIFNNQFEEKLGGALGKTKTNNMFSKKHRPTLKEKLPNLYMIGTDGVHHININYNGVTDLGKAIHPSSELKFNHSLFGKFLTVDGFSRWFQTPNGDDEYRVLRSKNCYHYANSQPAPGFTPNLIYFTLGALWEKIKSYPELMNDIGTSTLPFDSYYYSIDRISNEKTATRVRHHSASWLIEGAEIIREAIIDEKEPDFSDFIDDMEAYSDLMELVSDSITPPAILDSLKPKEIESKSVEPAKVKPTPKPNPHNPPGTGKKAKAKARAKERERLELERLSQLFLSDMNAFMALPQEGLVLQVSDKFMNTALSHGLGVTTDTTFHTNDTPEELEKQIELLNSSITPVVQGDVKNISEDTGFAEITDKMLSDDISIIKNLINEASGIEDENEREETIAAYKNQLTGLESLQNQFIAIEKLVESVETDSVVEDTNADTSSESSKEDLPEVEVAEDTSDEALPEDENLESNADLDETLPAARGQTKYIAHADETSYFAEEMKVNEEAVDKALEESKPKTGVVFPAVK